VFKQSKEKELRRELLRLQMKRSERERKRQANRRSSGSLPGVELKELKKMSENVAAEDAKQQQQQQVVAVAVASSLMSPASSSVASASLSLSLTSPVAAGDIATIALVPASSGSGDSSGAVVVASSGSIHRSDTLRSKSTDSTASASLAALYEDDAWAYAAVVRRIGRWLPRSPLHDSWQAKLRVLALDKRVDAIFFLFIVCDWALLCGRHYGMTESTRDNIDNVNTFFVSCFVLEMVTPYKHT
jgi:hypothetical protein